MKPAQSGEGQMAGGAAREAGCAPCAPISFMALHNLKDTSHDPVLSCHTLWDISVPREDKCHDHRDPSQPFNQQHSEAHRVSIQMGKNSSSEYLSNTNSPPGILDSKNH